MIGKAEIAVMADHDVIKHPDSNHFPNLRQPLGDLDIFLAGLRITRWVVVQVNFVKPF